MAIIESKNVSFDYIRRDEEGNVEDINKAVNQVNIDVRQGDFVAILGHNGSGKSTLAKLLNGILEPDAGELVVAGRDLASPDLTEDDIFALRREAHYRCSGIGNTHNLRHTTLNIGRRCICHRLHSNRTITTNHGSSNIDLYALASCIFCQIHTTKVKQIKN